MKENVGQLTLKGFFLGILVCLAIGVAIFHQFRFEQKVSPQDTTLIRLKELERKMIETQTALDKLKETINQPPPEAKKGGSTKRGPSKHH